MRLYLLIGLGGAFGSVLRFWLGNAIASRVGTAFPWGTLLVNVLGSVAIGFFAALTAHEGRTPLPEPLRVFFMVGVCGGFTTFSAFSHQTLQLLQAGEWTRASVYVVGSVITCLVGVWAGHVAALALPR